MKREYQATVLVLVGLLAIRVAATDLILDYVKAGMRPFLLVSGIVLVVLGGWAWVDVLRGTGDGHEHDHGHHGHGPAVAWLLLAPFLLVAIAAPSALGSYTAAQQGQGNATAPIVFPALPLSDPVSMPLFEYVNRAVWDSGRTLQGRTVELTGFATPDPDGGWWLSRLAVSCCAADAAASLVKVVDVEDLPADTWVKATGEWIAGGGLNDPGAIPLLRVQSLQRIEPPTEVYE